MFNNPATQRLIMRTLTFLFGLLLTTSTLTAQDTTPPVLANVLPAPESSVVTLSQIEVFFDENVQGVQASDLTINGVAATNVLVVVPDIHFRFDFAQPATGAVTVAWAPAHAITDTAGNPFAGGSWGYTLNPAQAIFDVRINEFMANNNSIIRDDDGTYQDWIELYNPSDVSVNLGGCQLADVKGATDAWVFPDYILPGQSYLIVWASNKNRTNSLTALHTDFRISSSSGYLALRSPSGAVISAFDPYPDQRADVSYGRDPLDPGLVGFYTRPTPGDINATSGSATDFAPDVIFSRDSSTFVEPFELTLSTTSTNAVIRYVLLNSSSALGVGSTTVTNVPTTNSPIYTGPLRIDATTQVRARAFESGKLPGSPLSMTYFQISPFLSDFTSDLPIVIIYNFAQTPTLPNNQGDQTAVLASFDSNLDRASLTNKPNLVTRIGANDRGSSTAGQAKQNMAVEFWDEFNQDTDHPLLGMPAESDWVFFGINGFDPTLMHNSIFHWFGNRLGKYSSRTRYVEVFRKTTTGPISTNDYFGLYLIEEKPKRNANRVNIESLQPENTNAATITGGYLLRIDRLDDGDDPKAFNVPTVGPVGGQRPIIDYPDVLAPNRVPQRNYISNYMRGFVTALGGANFTDPNVGYAAWIDVDSWVENHIVNTICFNVDGFRLSGYFFKDRDKKIEQGPPWDCDRCLGTGGVSGSTPQADNRPFNPRIWRTYTTDPGSDQGTDFFDRSGVGVNWWYRLFRDLEFWQRYIDRYQALRTNEFSTEAVMAMVDGFHAEIREAQVREQERWAPTSFNYPRVGNQTVSTTAGAFTSSYTFNFGPTAKTYGTRTVGYYSNEVAFQKQWLADRLNFMDTNFLAMPTLNLGGGFVSPGTTVTVTGAAKPGTIIYYTLDGTDPRLPGGVISPSALSSAGPVTVTINQNIRLVARCYNVNHANLTNATLVGNPPLNSNWSGPVAQTYYTSVPPLRITEIMYHPANPPAGNTTDPENFEYVEVRNISDTPLNVNRFRLSGGVEFNFPNVILSANQRAVVVRDLAAFQSRYGTNVPGILILGVYSNNLANTGEDLVLEGGLREPILNFSYLDSWYPATDGPGFSLQIINDAAPTETWALASSWRESGVVNGTPGTVDTGLPNLATIYINEALTDTDPLPGDGVELYNPTASDVNIGGWYLTDNFSSPKKYRIPNNTTIPANGYLVFYQSNSFGLGATGFGLSSQGEEIYIFSADLAGNLTGWVHGFDFGVQATGVTFGRVVLSTGEDRFVTQSAPTLGAANAGPKVGPLVITEINYHPIELLYPKTSLDNDLDEYIEIQNISAAPVPLYDPQNPGNRWLLRDAVDFVFPTGATLAPGAFALIVGFDPNDAATLAEFKAVNNVPAGVPVFGPWSGQLDNSMDGVELARPDVPEAGTGFVAFILADKVNYEDASPWPTNLVDGGGFSIHRVNAAAYGNDPANWRASVRSAGAVAPPTGGTAPQVTAQPGNVLSSERGTATFTIAATGSSPLSYQWLFNGIPLRAADSPTLTLTDLRLNDAGAYSCRVMNPAGSAVSDVGTLTVRTVPRITVFPLSRNVIIGPDNRAAKEPVIIDGVPTNIFRTNVTFTVAAVSSFPPLTYQWRFNGEAIPGATASTLTITNVQLPNEGDYACTVSDLAGSITTYSARLGVWFGPIIVQASPASTNFVSLGSPLYTNFVPVGSPITFSAEIIGNPAPFSYVLRTSGNLTNHTTTAKSVILRTNAPAIPVGSTFRIIVTNVAQPNITVGQWAVTYFITTLADNDRDGIPDNYEVALGLNTNNAADALGDLDLDGMSNQAEYQVGTDPTNNQSYLRVDLDATSGVPTVEVAAVADRSYSVQYSDVLGSLSWTKLRDVYARSTNRVELIPDPNWTSNRFYRIVSPQQP